MAQVAIHNFDDSVLHRLRQPARRNHRSLEDELCQILTTAALPSRPELTAKAEALAQALEGRWIGDGTPLIREDRNR